jgi:DNA polymerase-3 subunit alpha
MARATLEDTTGSIDLVIFPAVFDRLASVLRSGGVLLVDGTLQLESERPELWLERALPLDEAWAQLTSGLCLRVAGDAISPEKLAELRRLLDLAAGEVPVKLEVRLQSGASALFELPRHRVAVTAELVRRLERMLGNGSVECAVSLP